MFSDPDLLHKFFTVPSAIENMNCSPFMAVITSFALSLFAWISDASIFSGYPMSATKMSPSQVPPACTAYRGKTPGKPFGPI